MLSEVIDKGLFYNSLFYQQETYRKAREILVKNNLKSILDVGCGGLGKLCAFIYPFTQDIIGYDLSEVIEKLKNVPFGKWYARDLNNSSTVGNSVVDIIISADCVEHVLLTDEFFKNIKRHCSKETFIVLSTPDSSTTLRQRQDHKHLWNKEDFIKVIEHNGFQVLECLLIPELDSQEKYLSTLVVCKIKEN